MRRADFPLPAILYGFAFGLSAFGLGDIALWLNGLPCFHPFAALLFVFFSPFAYWMGRAAARP